MHRRRFLGAAGSSFAALVAGCSDGGSSESRHVSMTDGFAFDPRTVTVSVGTTVRWVNDSDAPHTVTAYGNEIPDAAAYFASGDFEDERTARNNVQPGLLETSEAFEHTFETSGTYRYFCIPHEGSGMVGRVVVE